MCLCSIENIAKRWWWDVGGGVLHRNRCTLPYLLLARATALDASWRMERPPACWALWAWWGGCGWSVEGRHKVRARAYAYLPPITRSATG